MKITAWFIVEYQGFSASVQVVPWHKKSTFIIKKTSLSRGYCNTAVKELQLEQKMLPPETVAASVKL